MNVTTRATILQIRAVLGRGLTGLPRISLLLAFTLLSIYGFWQADDDTRIDNAARQHIQSGLYALEARNYFSHLAQSGKDDIARQLEAKDRDGDALTVARHLVADRDFTYTMQATDSSFWGGSVYPRWYQLRAGLNDKTRHFSKEKGGLSGADKRPLTFFTHGFLSLGAMHASLHVFLLVIVGKALERRLGGLTLLLVFVASTAVTGFLQLLPQWQSANPHVGADGATSALVGIFSWLYRKNKRVWSIPGRSWRLAMPDAVILLPWAITATLSAYLWAQSVTTAISGILLGLLTGWLIERNTGKNLSRPLAQPGDPDEIRCLDRVLTQLGQFDFKGAEATLAATPASDNDSGDSIERLFMLRQYRGEKNQDWLAPALEKSATQSANLPALARIFDIMDEATLDDSVPDSVLVNLLSLAVRHGQHDFAMELSHQGIRRSLRDEKFLSSLQRLASHLRLHDEAAARKLEQWATQAQEHA